MGFKDQRQSIATNTIFGRDNRKQQFPDIFYFDAILMEV